MYKESESVPMSSQPSAPTSALCRAVLCPLLSTPTWYQSDWIYCGAHLLRTSLEILHTPKTKELRVGFNRNKTDLHPTYLDGNCVERVLSFKFLGVHMDQWSSNTTAVRNKALRRISLNRELLIVLLRVSDCIITILYSILSKPFYFMLSGASIYNMAPVSVKVALPGLTLPVYSLVPLKLHKLSCKSPLLGFRNHQQDWWIPEDQLHTYEPEDLSNRNYEEARECDDARFLPQFSHMLSYYFNGRLNVASI